MSLKRNVQKWISFKNLPMLNELRRISYSMEQIQRNQALQLSGGNAHTFCRSGRRYAIYWEHF